MIADWRPGLHCRPTGLRPGWSPSKVRCRARSRSPVARCLAPLMELRSSTECYQPRCVASHRLNAPSSSLVPRRDSTLRYSASRPFRMTKVVRKSSREVPLSFRVLPAHTVARRLVWATPSMGFLAPSSVVSVRSPLPRVCLARYVPLPGFLNLLAAYSSDHLAGLFHPADTPGISPFRAFSS